jgi:type II secretory pathway component PulF
VSERGRFGEPPRNEMYVLLLLLVSLVYGWMLVAYFHYREGRQEEFLHLLTTAVETDAPLAPAVWAYLEDRPSGWLRKFWVALLLFFVMPGYYWFWHRRHSYDQKVAAVAHRLEQGDSLPDALRATPGVASRETILAAAVGQSTGQLARCLRSSARTRQTTVWPEILPRVVYPLFLLLFLSGITGFWMTWIVPRLLRIFEDFDIELPALSEQLIDLWQPFVDALRWGFLGLAGLLLLLGISSTVRWYFPGLGRLYRMKVQSQVLKMLSLLLETGKPVPESLAVLAGAGHFSRTVRRRLNAVRQRVEQGEPLADSLRRRGLLPPNLVPLVQAAERARNLPWALGELGDNRANWRIRSLRRISLLFFPAIMVVIGFMVGCMVLGMFLPLVEIMTRLSS